MAEALCVLTGGKLLMLAISSFSLSWTHSVEKTQWREHWQIAHGKLQVVQASVQGSGAGMDPPEGSILTPGGWTYAPHVPPQPDLVLGASGATVSPGPFAAIMDSAWQWAAPLVTPFASGRPRRCAATDDGLPKPALCLERTALQEPEITQSDDAPIKIGAHPEFRFQAA